MTPDSLVLLGAPHPSPLVRTPTEAIYLFFPVSLFSRSPPPRVSRPLDPSHLGRRPDPFPPLYSGIGTSPSSPFHSRPQDSPTASRRVTLCQCTSYSPSPLLPLLPGKGTEYTSVSEVTDWTSPLSQGDLDTEYHDLGVHGSRVHDRSSEEGGTTGHGVWDFEGMRTGGQEKRLGV